MVEFKLILIKSICTSNSPVWVYICQGSSYLNPTSQVMAKKFDKKPLGAKNFISPKTKNHRLPLPFYRVFQKMLMNNFVYI